MASNPRGLVATLTMNPAIDLCFSVDGISPTRKLRAYDLRRDPGGGGINVARVIGRLGGEALAVFPAGGPTGERLRSMLEAGGTAHRATDAAGETREDFTAWNRENGEQYRFVLPGPELTLAEQQAALEAVMESGAGIIVASGSLPSGVPAAFYAGLALRAREAGSKLALDAAGPALAEGLVAGVWLVKPNLGELEQLVGAPLPVLSARLGACRDLIGRRAAEVVALSMGPEGALLATEDGAWLCATPPLTPISTVGAGDSFMGGLVQALADGRKAPEALARAVAAGSAALLAPGTQLCQAEDVARLAREISATRL